MVAKPVKTLEVHYPVIQFLTIRRYSLFPRTKNNFIAAAGTGTNQTY